VLDIACGTGVLGRAAISSGAAVKATGVDSSPDYVAFAARGVPSARARFQIGCAEAPPFAEGTFEAALALLVLQDFDQPARAVREMARVTRSGGGIAACVWDFEHGLSMLSLLGRRPRRWSPMKRWKPVLGRSTPTSAFVARVNEETVGALARVLARKTHGAGRFFCRRAHLRSGVLSASEADCR
jgi:ubiquinone/menaquinone biosynthesis C-methylase UbiE